MQYNAYELVAAMVWSLHRSLLWWWCSVSPPELLWFLPLARTRLKTGFFLWIICAKLKLARRARVRHIKQNIRYCLLYARIAEIKYLRTLLSLHQFGKKVLATEQNSLFTNFCDLFFDHSSKGFSSLRENNNQRWLHHLDWKEPLPSGILIEDKTKWGVFFEQPVPSSTQQLRISEL